ncbi:MAG: TetR family transcriptional regulator [Propionibacterium sp.]|nr:MAG: TetR family transcriptional regulator [Propionibacterium sp.]
MSLTRDDVLSAAVEILDSYGLADLTMRRLAANLGVQPGALYWHFANKQTLLAAIADLILSDLELTNTADWQAGLQNWANQFHQLLRAHRSGAELVSSVLALRDWTQSPGIAIEKLLIANGISADIAYAGAANLLHLVLGHTFDEEQSIQLVELGVKDKNQVKPEELQKVLATGVQLIISGLENTLVN